MTINRETRVIDLTVGQLENIFEKFSQQSTSQVSAYSKPMTTEQLSEFLDMPLPTIYSKVGKGAIPYIKEGGKLRFIPEQIMDWLKANQKVSVKDTSNGNIAETSFQQFKQKRNAKK